jgi:hypothetical protein
MQTGSNGDRDCFRHHLADPNRDFLFHTLRHHDDALLRDRLTDCLANGHGNLLNHGAGNADIVGHLVDTLLPLPHATFDLLCPLFGNPGALGVLARFFDPLGLEARHLDLLYNRIWDPDLANADRLCRNTSRCTSICRGTWRTAGRSYPSMAVPANPTHRLAGPLFPVTLVNANLARFRHRHHFAHLAGPLNLFDFGNHHSVFAHFRLPGRVGTPRISLPWSASP